MINILRINYYKKIFFFVDDYLSLRVKISLRGDEEYNFIRSFRYVL